MSYKCEYCGETSDGSEHHGNDPIHGGKPSMLIGRRLACKPCYEIYQSAQNGAPDVLKVFRDAEEARRPGPVRRELQKLQGKLQAEQDRQRAQEEERRLKEEALARVGARTAQLQEKQDQDEAEAKEELKTFLAQHPEYLEEVDPEHIPAKLPEWMQEE